MLPIVIDLQKTDHRRSGLRQAEYNRDVIHQVVQTLTEGKLVIFPTETVYGIGASACSEQGVQRLLEAKGDRQHKPFTLAIKSAVEALDYVPKLGAMGQRMARRCWPGPVTLVLDHTPGEGLVDLLPPGAQKSVLSESPDRVVSPSSKATKPEIAGQENIKNSNQTIGLRVPAHSIVLEVLQMLTGPIVLSSANRSGEPVPASVSEALKTLKPHVAIALDDGSCHYGQPSTVVRVTQSGYSCLREGVVGNSALDRLSSMIILFVCTGNTCRSPMAEAIMRRQIAQHLDIEDDALEQSDPKTGRNGIMVVSAGIAALPGCGPSSEAVEVMKEKGFDLRNHESQPLTDKLVQHADLIFTMTAAHRQSLLRRWPDASLRTHVVRTDDGNIVDPIGGTTEVYRQCREQIYQAVKARFENIEF